MYSTCVDYFLLLFSSIRLQELGPRLTLELMKVERGLCEGEVLYHSYLTKTQEEVSLDIIIPKRVSNLYGP